MNLLQMSRSGAVMILAIIVIRALAINKLPKKTFLVLWGVVMVRLLIPYSLPSAFSVYSLLERYTPAAEAVTDIPAVPFTPFVPSHNMMPIPGTAATDMAAATVEPRLVIWLVGGLSCAVFFATAYLKCRQEFKSSFPVDNEYTKHWLNEHRIYRAIEIRQSGRIYTPLTYGVFRPVILMPKNTNWNDLDALKYVLTHEYVHIRRFDAVTKLALTAALCVHWFNPMVWIMYVLANRDMELSCDEAVVRLFGDSTKSAYARTLIRMEETRSGLTPLCNNFSKNAIEERIIAIMKIKKTSLVTLIVAVALVVGMTTAFATSAKVDNNSSIEDLGRGLDAAGIVSEDTMIPDDVTQFLYSYLDTCMEHPENAVDYVHFESDDELDAFSRSHLEILDYEILGAKKINDKLYAFAIKLEKEYDTYPKRYYFVGSIDNELYLMVNAENVPEILHDGFNKNDFVLSSADLNGAIPVSSDSNKFEVIVKGEGKYSFGDGTTVTIERIPGLWDEVSDDGVDETNVPVS